MAQMNSLGYGWAGMAPHVLALQLQVASARFAELRSELQVDAIAFSGSSGCAVAFHLAVQHQIPLIYVRKPDEKAHGEKVECNSSADIRRYLIVDDFVFTGETVVRIINAIQVHTERSPVSAPECVGVLCFDTLRSSEGKRQFNFRTLPVYGLPANLT